MCLYRVRQIRRNMGLGRQEVRSDGSRSFDLRHVPCDVVICGLLPLLKACGKQVDGLSAFALVQTASQRVPSVTEVLSGTWVFRWFSVDWLGALRWSLLKDTRVDERGQKCYTAPKLYVSLHIGHQLVSNAKHLLSTILHSGTNMHISCSLALLVPEGSNMTPSSIPGAMRKCY